MYYLRKFITSQIEINVYQPHFKVLSEVCNVKIGYILKDFFFFKDSEHYKMLLKQILRMPNCHCIPYYMAVS